MKNDRFNQEVEKEIKKLRDKCELLGIPCSRAKAMKMLIDMANSSGLSVKRKPRSREVLFE